MLRPYNPGVAAPDAETAYLFRHALLRDAAYQMQMPSERGRLHALALGLIEEMVGSVPVFEQDPFTAGRKPHPCDSFAAELAAHAAAAASLGEKDDSYFRSREAVYLWRSAIHHRSLYRLSSAKTVFASVAEHAFTPPMVRASASSRAGYAAWHTGCLDEAQAHFGRAIALTREPAHARAHCVALMDLAGVQTNQGRYDEAESLLKRAAEIAEARHDATLKVDTLVSLGILLRNRNRIEESIGHHLQALELAEREGSAHLQSLALSNLGNSYGCAGRFLEAKSSIERSQALEGTQIDLRQHAILLSSLADIEHALGHHEAAERLLRESLKIAVSHGARPAVALRTYNLANVLAALDRNREAQEAATTCHALALELGDRKLIEHSAKLIQKFATTPSKA